MATVDALSHGRNRLAGLDLLRAVAILLVMVYHAWCINLIPDSVPLAEFGWVGVDLFFALSGFLIAGQLFAPYAEGRTPQFGIFYLRRLMRTLPAYLVVVALYFMVPAFRELPDIQPLWQFLTFTQNWFIRLDHWPAFSHAWSLCVEEQFYLVVPVLIWCAMRRPRAWQAVALIAAVVLAGMALRGYLWEQELVPVLHAKAGPGSYSRRFFELIYYPTWTRLDDLVGGVTLALVKSFRPALWAALMRRANLLALAGLAVAGGAVWLMSENRTYLPIVFSYPLLAFGLACVVASAASPYGLLGRYRVPGARPVATMAYSLYLTHKEVYHLVLLALGWQLSDSPVLELLVFGGAALAGGALLYFAVERPFLRLRDRLRSPVKMEQAFNQVSGTAS
jgi:peptidoglycan/LPS O-acetylase OafA/YrhL